MPYFFVCSAIPDDGKLHERNGQSTICGKTVDESVKSIRVDGKMVADYDLVCPVCFKYLYDKKG